MEQCGLAGAPGDAVGAGGVLAVLDDVQVEPAQLLYAEVVHLGIDVPEAVLAVRLFDLALQEQGTIDRPAIQGQHFLGRQQISGRIETVQVGQQEARGIADPPVGIGAALENLLGYRDLARVIGRGYPQAQDVGAQGIDDGLRHHGIAQ